FEDTGDRGAATGIAAALVDPLNSLGSYSDGHDGRLPAAVTQQDEGAFRTPGLRCVAMRPTFMHSGQIGSLAAVVAFFDQGGDGDGYPGVSQIHALSLTPLDESDLVAFLQSLTGPGADPKYRQPL
ncbi:MAG: cytochrome-c peroxidase, partial [Polyangiaceae bacterium]